MKTIYLIMGFMAAANILLSALEQQPGVCLLNGTMLVFWTVLYRGRA